MAIVSSIMCSGLKGEIGRNNGLLVNFKEELQYFRSVTQGKSILFGHKTFKGLPSLKGRNIYVLTSQDNISYPNATVVKTVEEFLELTKDEEEVFIGGGASVYKDTEHLWDRFYLSVLNMTFPDADAHFTSTEKKWIDIKEPTILHGKNGLMAKCYVMEKGQVKDE